MTKSQARLPYRASLAGTLLAAREAVMAQLRPVLREAGLTEQQWRVLRVLVDEGEADPSGLSQSGLLYAPSVTRILKELVDRGLVVRASDPDDGRRSIIAVTARGVALVEKTARKTSTVLSGYSDSFGAERLDALQSELMALVSIIGAPEKLADGVD